MKDENNKNYKSEYYHINDTKFLEITPIDIGYLFTDNWLVENNYPYYLLHFIEEGTAYIEINNSIYKVKKNQMFLIPPNIDVKYYNKNSQNISFFWLNFNGLKCNDVLSLTKFSNSIVIADSIYKKEIKSLLKDALNDCKNKISRSLAPFSALYNILNLLVKENIPNINFEKDESENFFKSILNTINNFIFSNELSEKFICDKIYINQEYFSRLFFKKMGTNFTSYITIERIKKACELLENTNLEVKSISMRVGYSSEYYFCRVFKKYRLCTPTEYRNKQLNKN